MLCVLRSLFANAIVPALVVFVVVFATVHLARAAMTRRPPSPDLHTDGAWADNPNWEDDALRETRSRDPWAARRGPFGGGHP